MPTVAGLFHTAVAAHRALEDLRTAGIDPQQMSVIAAPASAGDLAREIADELPISTVGGSGLDTLLGAAASELVGAGTVVLSGLGPVLVTGPIAAALGVVDATDPTTAGVGAATSDLPRVLASWGFAEAEAREYLASVAQGEILLAVTTIDDAAAGQTTAILHQSGAERVSCGSARG
jgi:hypothetical protein